MNPSTDDLYRSMGRLEGSLDAMENRFDRFEGLISKGIDNVGGTLKGIDARLGKIETRESERRGAWAVLVGIASMLSGFFGAVITWWIKLS